MALPGFNDKNEGGLVTSETFNLTRIITLLAGLVGIGATVSGAAASGSSRLDWAGFNQGQRVVLLVALLGAIALVSAADLLARAYTSASKGGSKVTTLPAPKDAQLHKQGPDIDGKVLALRSGDPPDVFFYDPKRGTATWVALNEITFR